MAYHNRVVVLVLKDKFKVLVLGAQVLVLDTHVLVLEEKSLVVSLFLVFFRGIYKVVFCDVGPCREVFSRNGLIIRPHRARMSDSPVEKLGFRRLRVGYGVASMC